MSFRKEEKIKVHFSQKMKLMDWIISEGGKELHPARIVSSTYFDNANFGMFNDSEEGSIPRKKLRLRSYHLGEHRADDTKLEVKHSSVEGRYKTTSDVDDPQKLIKRGIFDKDYGLCKPKVRVSYSRVYYEIHNVRLTIDSDIEFIAVNSNFSSKMKHKIQDIAVEIKAPMTAPIEYLVNKFPFDRVRFSKYSKAILETYKNSLDHS